MSMNGYKYERFCAKYLAKHGYRHVRLTQKSGDQGIDIIAYKQFKKYGFQCKYYSSPVGNKAVQEAYSGAAFYNCEFAGVITNSTFTAPAAELAEKTGVILLDGIAPDIISRFKFFLRDAALKASLVLCIAAALLTLYVKLRYGGDIAEAWMHFITASGISGLSFLR